MVLARAIRTITAVAVGIIVLAVVLRLLGANQSNTIVSDIHDAGAWLVGPFANVFSVSGPKLHMALNWGLAAVVYAVVGGLLAHLAARGASAGFGRRRSPNAVS
jgi:hypothetical protein